VSPAASLAAVALAIACSAGLIACGEDDEPAATTTPAGATGVSGETETTTGESPTTTTTTTPDEGSPADQGSGGTAAPFVPDEGHEGGGPDPGTEEAEAAEENAAGGVGTEQPQGSSGGQSPTDAFEQFCEQNPRACE
jgi:hypothetical protein